MKRKLLAIFMSVLLLSSLALGVSAIETGIEIPENIYWLWGEFDKEEFLEKVNMTSERLQSKSIVNDGANQTPSSLLINGIYNESEVYFDFPTVIGENYDISFWVKPETTGLKTVQAVFVFDDGGQVFGPEVTLSDSWTEYKTNWTCPDVNDEGKKVDGECDLLLRFAGVDTYSVKIDGLYVSPKGLKARNYTLVNAGLLAYTESPYKEEIKSVNSFFSDIKTHWAKQVIDTLAQSNFVNGMGDGTFSPDTQVTRAQFVKMVADLYDTQYESYDGRFLDVKGNEWFAEVLMKADQKKIIPEAMKQDGKFNPDTAITREEAASIAVCAALARGAKVQSDVSFDDLNDASDWAKAPVADAASLGIINGYGDGTFKPKANITRAEASQILFRIIEVSDRLHIYVDAKTGNDNNDGTVERPLKTITAARDMASKLAPDMKNNITVLIRGEQYLEETFKLDETNSGKNGYKIIYTSWGNEKASITMAKKYSDFQLHDKDKNIWKTYVGKDTRSRHAYFNDVPGIRSRSVGYLKNPEYVYGSHYFLCDNTELLDFKYPDELDLVFHILWIQNRHKASKIYKEGDRIRIDMNEYFHNHRGRNDYDANKNLLRQTPSYIENAYELLDEKGEWYLNHHDGYMYYIPRDGENMADMECKLSIGEELMKIEGKDYKTPVSHISFDNLIFEGTTDLRVDRVGGANYIQNCVTWEDTPSSSSTPAVNVRCARYVDITDCDFRHLGNSGAALQLDKAVKHMNIIGNEIYQVGGVGMQLDSIAAEDSSCNINERQPLGFIEYINIENNYIHDTGLTNKGAVAVAFTHPRHIKFSHNEISNVPYSAMSVGWGWAYYAKTGTPLYDIQITDNYIHDMMKDRVSDGSAIYTLGAQDLSSNKTDAAYNSIISGNYLTNGWHCNYVYPDEGSTSWYVANNVSDHGPVFEMDYNFDRSTTHISSHDWMKMWTNTIMWITTNDNYSTLDYAYQADHMNQVESNIDPTNIVTDGNWPKKAQNIMKNAGIEPEYRDNFDLTGPKILASSNRWQYVNVGEPVDSKLIVLGDYNTEYPISDFNIDWWTDDPEALTIDKNGMVTAHKSGTHEAEAFVTVNGVTQSQHFMFVCDELERVSFPVNNVHLVKNYRAEYNFTGYMKSGDTFSIDNKDIEWDIKCNDENILKISTSDYGTFLLTASDKVGETTITGYVKYQGKKYQINLPVEVTDFGNPEAETLPYKVVDFSTGWKNPGTPTDDGGVLVSGSPNHTDATYSGLVAFDVSINPGSTWPTISFSDSDFTGSYMVNDCYMFGVKEDQIEFQKFNKGKRTMIYGNEFGAIAGPGVPNLEGSKVFEYNKRYSVIMGAIDTDEGTRLVLTVNGKNLIDYMDTSDTKIKASGHYVVYNPAPGGMTFYPFSNMKE